RCSPKIGKRHRPCCLRRGGAVVLVPPCETRGAKRRQALARKRRARGPPRGRTDLGIARDHRPMTPAGAPLGAPPWRFLAAAPFFRDRTGGIAPALIPAAFAAVHPALVQPHTAADPRSRVGR